MYKDEKKQSSFKINKEAISKLLIERNISANENTPQEEIYFETLIEQSKEHHEIDVQERRDRAQMRIEYANKVFRLSVVTLFVIGYLIAAAGYYNTQGIVFLSDRVLRYLLIFAGTNVLGLFSIILTYLYKRKS